MLDTSSVHDDRPSNETYKGIIDRRRQILDACVESFQWMAEFVHILSDPVSKLNRLSMTKVTIDHNKTVGRVVHEAFGRNENKVASSWNDVLNQLFDFFCSDIQNDGSRVEIAASLAVHVFEHMQKITSAADWNKLRKWIEKFYGLSETQHRDHFKKAHIKILLTLAGYYRLCYDATLTSDLAKRNVKLSSHLIEFSFSSAFERCKSCLLFLLRVSCCNGLDASEHWRLELSAVHRTLEFLSRFAESGRLFWDDDTIDKEL